MKSKFLAIIPARAGSKRIPNKNTRFFNGRPLIYYSVKQALNSGLFDRVIVDTDSPEIVQLAKKYGAEAPFLRPQELASDNAKIGDAIAHLLQRLRGEQNYIPDVIAILQTTSPLREQADIEACYKLMSDPSVTSVATVCETSPWFFNFSSKNGLVLINKKAASSTNTQDIQRGYFLNAAVFMVRTDTFMKSKKSVYFYRGETVGITCPKWRYVDLDHPEDWVLAEFIHKNKKAITKAINMFANKK